VNFNTDVRIPFGKVVDQVFVDFPVTPSQTTPNFERKGNGLDALNLGYLFQALLEPNNSLPSHLAVLCFPRVELCVHVNHVPRNVN